MEGLKRKAITEDGLRDAAQTQPVQLRAQGVTAGRTPERGSPLVHRLDLEIGNHLYKFAHGQLAKAVTLKQERSFLDGQMAYQQGQAFNDVEMEGDKWALEGYRVVQAQNIASSLLVAQEQEITSGANQMDPDQYRQQFVDRAAGVLSAAPDARTAELAREHILKHMPVLTQKHMAENLEWKEEQLFDSLVSSVDVISRDPTAQAQLIEFALGVKDTATEGLTDDRRKQAVTDGVIKALENDNPLAHAILSDAGLLSDELTTDQLNSIRSARNRFEGRKRKEYNEELMLAQETVIKDVTAGNLSPVEGVGALAKLYADHGISMTHMEGLNLYALGQKGNEQRKDLSAKINKEVNARIDMESMAASKPARDLNDARFLADEISQEEWENTNALLRHAFNLEHTKALIKHEAKILSTAVVNKFKDAKDAEQKQNQVAYNLGVQAELASFLAVADQVGNGSAPIAALGQAESQFFTKTGELREELGLGINVDSITGSAKMIRDKIVQAVEQSNKSHEERIVIDKAIEARALGELSARLQDKGVEENEKLLLQQSNQLIANGELTKEEQVPWIATKQLTFIAQQNVVSENMKQAINGHLAFGAIDAQGNARPGYIEAVNTYRRLAEVNPGLADKYINTEHKSAIDTIVHRIGGGGDAAVPGAVRTWGITRSSDQEDIDVDTYVARPEVQKRIHSAVYDLLDRDDLDIIDVLFGSAELNQAFDLHNLDNLYSEDNLQKVREALIYDLEQSLRITPGINPSDVVKAAARRLGTRSAVISGEVVILENGKNFGEMFFGAKASQYMDKPGVINTAIMDYLRSPEVQKDYPELGNTSLAEVLSDTIPDNVLGIELQKPGLTPQDAIDTIITGVRPFSVHTHPNTGALIVTYNNTRGTYAGSFALDTRAAGNLYMQNTRQNAIN